MDGSQQTALTLRGLLRSKLEPELALRLFEHIISNELTVYTWRVRGPRIFRMLTGECVAPRLCVVGGCVRGLCLWSCASGGACLRHG